MIRKILRYFKNRPDKSTQYEANILKGLVHRSHYAYCCYNAAKLASKLNHKKISVIEFGCAHAVADFSVEPGSRKAKVSKRMPLQIGKSL